MATSWVKIRFYCVFWIKKSNLTSFLGPSSGYRKFMGTYMGNLPYPSGGFKKSINPSLTVSICQEECTQLCPCAERNELSCVRLLWVLCPTLFCKHWKTVPIYKTQSTFMDTTTGCVHKKTAELGSVSKVPFLRGVNPSKVCPNKNSSVQRVATNIAKLHEKLHWTHNVNSVKSCNC